MKPSLILRGLVLLGGLLVLRVLYVLAIPDLDVDAYGHFHIARRVLVEPWNLEVHWVWLPGWHLVLAALQELGATFRDVRLGNAVLAAAEPVLTLAYARSGGRTPETSLRAAALVSVASLPTLAGTSALMEVPFALLLLGAAVLVDGSATDARRGLVAGLLLTLACTLRYEAWIAVAALSAVALLALVRDRFARDAVVRWIAVLGMPVAAICAYVVFRRRADGQWLWFIRETYRFTHMQRGLSTHGPAFELLWFPLLLPLTLLGPALALVPIGIAHGARRGRPRASIALPVGIALFLLTTYVGRGTLSHERYLAVLAPFACITIADGVEAVAARRPRALRIASIVAFASLVLATAAATARTASAALADETSLRAKERWASTD